jgi:hypothetical protein
VSLTVEQKDKDFSKFRHEIVDEGLLAHLSNGAVRVYLVILRHANYETGLSFPTVKTICKESGVNKNLISSATRELVLNGLIDKVKTSKRFTFRNCYRTIKHPKAPPCTIPKNTDKCRRYFQGKDGKFKPVPENTETDIPKNTDNGIPGNTEFDTCPKNSDKKKNLEIVKNRDKVLDAPGSVLARPNGQAEPGLNSKKSLKGISKETIHGFIKEKGLEWVKKYLRKSGYDEKEIENLSESEGADGAK